MSLTTCQGDSACVTWLTCVMACGDSACASQCDLTNSAASASYAAVYQCACANCPSECAVLGPCDTHPCTAAKLYPDETGMFCPHITGNFCAHQTQHCCENSTTSLCQTTGVACDPIYTSDWQCENPDLDCGTGQKCCTNAGAAAQYASSYVCKSAATNVTSSHCATSCQSDELSLCTADSQCPAGEHCWAFSAAAVGLGACH
jgi:hypothetical protein